MAAWASLRADHSCAEKLGWSGGDIGGGLGWWEGFGLRGSVAIAIDSIGIQLQLLGIEEKLDAVALKIEPVGDQIVLRAQ